ncbi:hypothetical protein [Streptomonospora wellingtoniae]|uniref:DUF317 domain-containing protein n=1 Tax=Streptomonospora wellingtoniae TaxID=3075544 RepID=A0ABU2KXU6_9ACTN|nr:hypothetical protein [Streptomonospora sp. DSM 45055]MDT0304126.1 hypothetical protein [Streptomonospora sp. DSM 45055]
MVNAWMPGTKRVPCAGPAGAHLQGGAPRAVWLTTESDPAALTARAVAQRLTGDGRTGHLVWNPRTGETAQLLPATAPAAGGLTAGAPDRACEGRVCIVVTVIGWSHAPFTDSPMCGLAAILRWLDSWGVARRWPAGAPAAAPSHPRTRGCDERLWARGGHFGHSQVPGAQTASPGALSPHRLLESVEPPGRARPLAAPPPQPQALPAIEYSANGERHYAGAAHA